MPTELFSFDAAALWPALAAWLLTYLVHSTLFLGGAWLLARVLPESTASIKESVCKLALLGGILTSAVQPAILTSLPDLAPWGGPVTLFRDSRASLDASGVVSVDPGRGGSIGRVPSPSTGSARLAQPAGPLGSRLIAWLPVLWIAGAVLAVARLLAIRLGLRRRLAPRRPLSDGPLTLAVARLSSNAGLRRRAELSVSTAALSPMALGRREVCLPERLVADLDFSQQEGVLAHEIAHLARRDPFWLTLCGWIEAVLFFQPLNRLVRRRLQEASEFLCDDWAVTQTGNGEALARSLARIASWIEIERPLAPVAGMAEAGSPLLQRVGRLLRGDLRAARRVPVTARVALAAGLLSLVGFFAPGITAGGGGMAGARRAAGGEGVSKAEGQEGRTYTWSDGVRRIEVRQKGQVEFRDGQNDWPHVSPNGLFRIEDRSPAVTAVLEVRPGPDGTPARSFSVNGRPRNFDESGRLWLAGVMDLLAAPSSADALPSDDLDVAGELPDPTGPDENDMRRAREELERAHRDIETRRRAMEAQHGDLERLRQEMERRAAEMERLRGEMERLAARMQERQAELEHLEFELRRGESGLPQPAPWDSPAPEARPSPPAPPAAPRFFTPAPSLQPPPTPHAPPPPLRPPPPPPPPPPAESGE